MAPMTEKQYDAAIKNTKAELERLQDERRVLMDAGYRAQKFCPRPAGAPDTTARSEHDWSVVSIDRAGNYGVACYECRCGATMTVTARPDRG